MYFQIEFPTLLRAIVIWHYGIGLASAGHDEPPEWLCQQPAAILPRFGVD